MKLKTQIVTKLKNSNCDKIQKLKLWQNSNCDKTHKTQIVTKTDAISQGSFSRSRDVYVRLLDKYLTDY